MEFEESTQTPGLRLRGLRKHFGEVVADDGDTGVFLFPPERLLGERSVHADVIGGPADAFLIFFREHLEERIVAGEMIVEGAVAVGAGLLEFGGARLKAGALLQGGQ